MAINRNGARSWRWRGGVSASGVGGVPSQTMSINQRQSVSCQNSATMAAAAGDEDGRMSSSGKTQKTEGGK